jgi:hypothetical protein
MKKPTNIFNVAMLLVFTLSSCKTLTTSSGEKIKPFRGTIVYDVQVIQIVDTMYIGDKTDFFGKEMHLTVFKNGNIQRKYFNASRLGYDLTYLDLKNNLFYTKYNHLDSLYGTDAGVTNIVNLKELPASKTTQKILSYDVKEIAIGGKEVATSLTKGDYLGIKYSYADAFKIDKIAYKNSNLDLWSFLMNKSDGSLSLRYEIDYYTYKVTYTATEILPGKYEKYKEKMSVESPRVIK